MKFIAIVFALVLPSCIQPKETPASRFSDCLEAVRVLNENCDRVVESGLASESYCFTNGKAKGTFVCHYAYCGEQDCNK
jgi:hypothetical protein